ncbi:MAG: hypothetical protein IT353_10430 [Gemmatimonadaceae bacterium]|nr:hypothetical protein [Gemmatimonadaceae bacterium]
MARIEFVGDKVVAIDRANSKIKVFDDTGRFVSEVNAAVASLGSSCAISSELLAIGSLGVHDITFLDMMGNTRGSIHRLTTEEAQLEPLLRLPLLVKSPRAGSCIAIRPYGGTAIEFSKDSVLRRIALYRDSRPVRVQRRGSVAKGNEVRVIRGSPTIEDLCVAGEYLLALRSSSKTTKVVDVFRAPSLAFLGSLPIDPSTISVACDERTLIAKEYRDGLLGFAGYAIRR